MTPPLSPPENETKPRTLSGSGHVVTKAYSHRPSLLTDSFILEGVPECHPVKGVVLGTENWAGLNGTQRVPLLVEASC